MRRLGSPHEEGSHNVGNIDGGIIGGDTPVEGEEQHGENGLVKPAAEQVVHVGVVAGRSRGQHDPHVPPRGVGASLLRR